MRKILLRYAHQFYLILITMVSIFTILACSDNATEAQKEIVLPEKGLNFETHIKPLFINKCASGSGCHSAFDPVSGLNLTDYQTIMTYFAAGTNQLVIPGQADQSFLYQILVASQLGIPRMPPDLPPLNSNNINGVKTWINEGAEQFP